MVECDKIEGLWLWGKVMDTVIPFCTILDICLYNRDLICT